MIWLYVGGHDRLTVDDGCSKYPWWRAVGHASLVGAVSAGVQAGCIVGLRVC